MRSTYRLIVPTPVKAECAGRKIGSGSNFDISESQTIIDYYFSKCTFFHNIPLSL